MIEHLISWPFLAAITLLTLSPGVDTLLVLRNAFRGGWLDGLLTSVGICSGLFVHALVSAAGLSVILLGSAQWFLAFKLLGAAYLIWLGIRSLRAVGRARGLSQIEVTATRLRPLRSLQEGVLSNLLNPKPIVFYMAFLPHFMDPSYSSIPQALVMGAVHFLVGMLWLGSIAIAVERAQSWLAKPKVGQTVDGITGLFLVFIGGRLAVS